MKEYFIKPVNSHLLTYDEPKVAIAKGFIERVFGIMLSQHIDKYGNIVTNRTLLCDEEMNANWDVSSSDNDSLSAVHYFKEFPNISMKDVKETIVITNGTRDVYESFSELLELGCVVPEAKENLSMTVQESGTQYSFYCKELGMIDVRKGWIPTCISILYSIQSFLGRRIVLTPAKHSDISEGTVNMMNEVLANQLVHKVRVENLYGEGNIYVNDGVNTYSSSGTKVAMTREEFFEKHKESFELLG